MSKIIINKKEIHMTKSFDKKSTKRNINAIKTFGGKSSCAIYFKSTNTHMLIILNENHQPMSCWVNAHNISSPLQLKIISNEIFNKILNEYKPSIIYANTCEYIELYIQKSKPKIIQSNTTPYILLKELKCPNQSNMSENKKTKPEWELSFKEMKQLDSKITRADYKKMMVQ